MMPKMDGVEATKEIRNLGGKYEKLPIVALTANAISGMKEMFMANGFDGFLSKPIAMRELDEVLKEWLAPGKIAQNANPDAEANAGDADGADSDALNVFLDGVHIISEINVEIGLSRFSGKRGMYREAMSMFYKKLISECDNMVSFLNDGDIKGFSISVHAMKSLLATVGAMELSEAAARLEEASKNGETDFCTERFPELREKLTALHKLLSAVFPDKEAAAEKMIGDSNILRANVRRAMAAVEDFDGDAGISLLKELTAYHFNGQVDAMLNNALSALEDYKFSEAIEILNKMEGSGYYAEG